MKNHPCARREFFSMNTLYYKILLTKSIPTLVVSAQRMLGHGFHDG